MNRKLIVDLPEEIIKKLKHEAIDQNLPLREIVKRKLE